MQYNVFKATACEAQAQSFRQVSFIAFWLTLNSCCKHLASVSMCVLQEASRKNRSGNYCCIDGMHDIAV